MAFLEKFLAAWLLVGAAIAFGAACLGVFVGVLICWGWILAHLPTWGQYTVNILGASAICALIIAAIEPGHDDR